MTASPGDGEHAAREGYYPDPSIPGYIRYWNGAGWVPGTSRPAAAPAPAAQAAPAPAPAPVPAPAPAPAPVAAPVSPVAQVSPFFAASRASRPDETGPVFLDETSMTEALPEPAPGPGPASSDASASAPASDSASAAAAEPVVWQADPLHQAGFGGPRDHRVSWGSPPEPEAGPGSARPAGISLARTAAAAAAPARLPAQAPVQASAQASAPSAQAPAGAAGILSARSPAAQRPAQAAPAQAAPAQAAPAQAAPAPNAAAPAARPPAPQWPEAPGAGGSGLTSSWPEAAAAPAPSRPQAPAAPASRKPRSPEAVRRAPAPAEPAATARPAAEPAATPRPEVWEPRPAGVRPKVPLPAATAPAEPRPRTWEPRGAEGARPGASSSASPSRPAGTGTTRAVFERMAERAARPAGLTRRAVARALDSLVYAAVAAGVARPLLPEATAHVQAKVDAARSSGRTTTVWLFDGTIAGHVGLVLGAVLLFGILYEALPTARWGRTPGKKLLGVRVLAASTQRPPSFGAALLRWLVYAFLGLPGSLWCLVDRPRRQAWHDKAAKTYVAR
ncbi:RDD family protein [Streptomyces sp. NBC_01310]|uniref:RDD family protein n=1 Tax=Streptomyces sp. NBC_01310 TaxID=2903820 RepID=UPI0035B5E50F|nr:RDD family protein [Streptomyces sp. NBC_01310]